MHHTGKIARRLGLTLGTRLGQEHRQLALHLDRAALHRVALLAWQFERHGVIEEPHLKRTFLESYRRGYMQAQQAGSRSA